MIPPDAGRPAILVPGIFDTADVFAPAMAQLGPVAGRCQAVTLPGADGSASLAALAGRLRDRIDALAAGGKDSIDLVGFSMGGLIGRYYLQRLGGAERVRKFVAIASPMRGTWAGYLKGAPAFRDMRPASAFLRDLDRDWQDVAQAVECHALWTPFDLIVWPWWHAFPPAGARQRILAPRHRAMLADARTWRAVARILEETA